MILTTRKGSAFVTLGQHQGYQAIRVRWESDSAGAVEWPLTDIGNAALRLRGAVLVHTQAGASGTLNARLLDELSVDMLGGLLGSAAVNSTTSVKLVEETVSGQESRPRVAVPPLRLSIAASMASLAYGQLWILYER